MRVLDERLWPTTIFRLAWGRLTLLGRMDGMRNSSRLNSLTLFIEERNDELHITSCTIHPAGADGSIRVTLDDEKTKAEVAKFFKKGKVVKGKLYTHTPESPTHAVSKLPDGSLKLSPEQ